MKVSHIVCGLTLCTALLLTSTTAPATEIIIQNMDSPGEGFNNTTPVSPVGGNTGTTLGEQRLKCFERAAALWETILDSDVPIIVEAAFDPLPCDNFGAVLGQAGPIDVQRDGPGFPFANTYFVVAQANAMRGSDGSPGQADIGATFNSQLGESASCLGGAGWYLGFDGNEGDGIDLLPVLLHEFGHGLGFLSLVDSNSGQQFDGRPDAYSRFLRDLSSGKDWPAMTNAERAASAVNSTNLVWTGPSVTAAFPTIPITAGTKGGFMRMFAPPVLQGGSSVSHWDTAATPNLLMEPSINIDLGEDIDLALNLMVDIGWPMLDFEEPEAPEINVTPLSRDFSARDIDAGASNFQNVTISNTGTASLAINGISLIGTDPGEFAISSGGGSGTLAPGLNRVVQLTFDPLSVGSKSATLKIQSNDQDEGIVNVALTGIGTNQVLTASPTSRAFGNQNINGGPTRTFSVTITNSGPMHQVISSVSLIGTNANQFAIQSGGGSGTIPSGGGTRTVQLVFDPSSVGQKNAVLQVVPEDPSEDIIEVPLSGAGFDPTTGFLNLVWVQFGFTGTEIGTEPNPFNTFVEGAQAVTVGGTVRIKTGVSGLGATTRISKGMRLEASGGLVRLGGN